MHYKYKDRKDKILKILNNSPKIQEKDIPEDDSNFTYDNGVRCKIGSIFVDIINSKELITKQDDIIVAKVLRAFTSEIICILNSSKQIRQIGIRGDCVYGTYSTPDQKDVYELANIAFYINTFMKMLNKLLTKNGLPNLSFGIGVAIGKDLVIKAGQKGTGINDKIWIGNAVVDACVLADKAGRNGRKSIGFNSLAYSIFLDLLKKENPEKDVESWFDTYFLDENEYYSNLIIPDFNTWIDKNL